MRRFSLSLSLTHTHTRRNSRTRTLSHSLTLSHSRTHPLSHHIILSHTHIHTPTLSPTHSLTHSLTLLQTHLLVGSRGSSRARGSSARRTAIRRFEGSAREPRRHATVTRTCRHHASKTPSLCASINRRSEGRASATRQHATVTRTCCRATSLKRPRATLRIDKHAAEQTRSSGATLRIEAMRRLDGSASEPRRHATVTRTFARELVREWLGIGQGIEGN